MAGPLSHIRVLDLSRVLAGPWAAQNLGDLGAEVIKVERPGAGDDTRGWGPPFLKDGAGKDTTEAAYYASVNRNKKSITLDLSKPEGQQIAREIAAKSAVLIENYKVGTLKRYGLGYDDLKKANPGLVYCSVTGFGQDGPYAPRPGYDFIFQGMGGLMSITGERDGQPGAGPQKVGIAITDVLTGMYASVAICAALTHRERTGEGQYIDCALLDTIVAFNANQIVSYFCSGRIPMRYGNAHAQVVPYEVFPTADGHIILAIGNDGQFQRFCEVAGCAELAEEPRFKTNSQRIVHRAELIPLIAEVMRTRSKQEWIEVLEAATVPCGPINNMKEVFEDLQVRHRALRVDIPHPLGGTAPVVANPMRFSGTPVEYRLAPPLLGQHNNEIYRGLLGKSEAEIAQLKSAGIL
ncbi:MAG TPA: CaiB/BaiF CoA-transferase family protein [Burkholderiales bacterium]|jgi:crotonobetainyl-CoA:carnitine CoA-transferase CaiB-like acyl-CoA transferase|nr:CaiB/BaiF CoA-transferase family protein [Burkholderiales bacterium]